MGVSAEAGGAGGTAVPAGLPEEIAVLLLHAAAHTPEAVLLVRDGTRSEVIWANATARLLLPDVAPADGVGEASGGSDLEAVLGPEAAMLLMLPDGRFKDVSVRVAAGVTQQMEARAQPVGSGVVEVVLRSDDDRRRAEEELLAERKRLAVIADRAPMAIFAAHNGMRLDYVNDRCAEIMGVTDNLALRGASWTTWVETDDVDAACDAVAEVLTDQREVEVSLRIRRADGVLRRCQARFSPVPDRGGYIGILEDVTAKHELHERLAHQASHDALTGLANRVLLSARIAEHLVERGADAGTGALLFIDLDHFKVVNDTLGHSMGDALLVEVARRIVATVRDTDMVARFGGDEFVVFLPEASIASAEAVAGRVLHALGAPVQLGEVSHQISGSIGVVEVSSAHTDPDAVVRDADVAMYQAKEAGRSTVARFDESARRRLERSVALEADLRDAIGAGQIEVVFEPIVALGADLAGTVIAAEARLRWVHPMWGDVSPEELVEVAEQRALLEPLFTLALERACELVGTWPEGRSTRLERISVDVPALRVRDPQLLTDLRRALDHAGMDADQLCLEVPEAALEAPAAMESLAGLRSLGVHLAVDDIGANRSSLLLLARSPMRGLKISPPLVQGLGAGDEAARAAVEATIRVAHTFGMRAAAVGVVGGEQLATLAAMGCDVAQGPAVSPPLSGPELIEHLSGPRR